MEIEYLDIVAGVLQGDTLARYLFIICLDYALTISIDKIKENGFELTKKRSNARKMEYICFNQTSDISTPDRRSLKLVDKFTYLGSSVSSTEKDIDTRLTKAWIAIDKLSLMWKSDLTDKRKRSFFQAAVVLILLYGCTTWTLTKRLEKKRTRQLHKNGATNIEQVLEATPHKPPTIRPPSSHHENYPSWTNQTYAANCWRSREELISDVLLWTPTYGRAKQDSQLEHTYSSSVRI